MIEVFIVNPAKFKAALAICCALLITSVPPVLARTPLTNLSVSNQRFERIKAIHPRASWIRVEDPDDSSTLSIPSLVAASSLVAIVRGEGSIAGVNHGFLRADFRAVHIERVLNDVRPSSSTALGALIVVAEQKMADGGEFADDLPLEKGEEALVFLQKLPRVRIIGNRRFELFRYTAPFVSKYGIGSDGRLTCMSIRRTVLSSQMNLRSSREFSESRHLAGSSRNYAPIFLNALIAKGIRSRSEVERFTLRLSRDPWGVEREFALDDAKSLGVIHHR